MTTTDITFTEYEWRTLNESKLTDDELLFLGIRKKNGSLKASSWVGVNCSADGDHTVCVLPKYEQFDPVSIFLDGLPYLGHREGFHPSKLFKLDVRSGKRVSMPEKLRSSWSLFLIIVFVEELKKLLDRRPKRDYRWELQNQIGVVRGRIRMQNHIRLNLSRGLPHRICTESLKFDQQTALNQILKEACIHAQQAWAHLYVESMRKLSHEENSQETDKPIHEIAIKLKACVDMLADIERPKIVTPTLISQARRGLKGHFAAYRPVLDWAVSIIRNDYCKMKVKDQTSYRTVPFALNMNDLFELHVRTAFLSIVDCVRHQNLDKKQQVFFPESEEDEHVGKLPNREPDLVLEFESRRILVECKYNMVRVKDSDAKQDWLEKFEKDESDKQREDGSDCREDPHFEVPRHGFFQSIAYMQLFKCDEGIIVYPSLSESRKLSGQIGVAETKSRFHFISIGKDNDITNTLSSKQRLSAILIPQKEPTGGP